MALETGKNHNSSERIISEDSSEESIVIITIDKPRDTWFEKSIRWSWKRQFYG